MTYRKHLNTKEVNQILEERFFNKKTLNNLIVEEKNQETKKDERVLIAIEKLNQKFGSK